MAFRAIPGVGVLFHLNLVPQEKKVSEENEESLSNLDETKGQGPLLGKAIRNPHGSLFNDIKIL